MKFTNKKFLYKKDLVDSIIEELEKKYLGYRLTSDTKNEMENFIRSIEKAHPHIIDEGDLEINVNINGVLTINSKTGFQIEELI